MMPPYDPVPHPDLDKELGRSRDESEVRYIDKSEATDEDKLTMGDKMAIMGGLAAAQLIRLLIIAAAVGLVALVIFVGSKL